MKIGMALGEIFENGKAVEHDRPVGLERRDTLPEGEWRRIASLLSGWRKRMRSSAKGMPQCFMAIHGLRLQEERFLSPMKRV